MLMYIHQIHLGLLSLHKKGVPHSGLLIQNAPRTEVKFAAPASLLFSPEPRSLLSELAFFAKFVMTTPRESIKFLVLHLS